jgi:hypothetical protein
MKFKMKFIKDEHPVTLNGIQEDNMDEADMADVRALVGVEYTVKKKVSQLAVEKTRQAEVAVIETICDPTSVIVLTSCRGSTRLTSRWKLAQSS